MDILSYAIGRASARDRLPSIYQEVEYLQSSSGAYIDTGYSINKEILESGLKVESEMAILSSSGATGVSNTLLFFFGCSGGKYYSGIGRSYPSSDISNDGEVHTFTLDSSTLKFSIDGEVATQYSDPTYTEHSGNLYIFDVYGEDRYPLSAKAYTFKVYSNGELVRNMIPCYRKSDSVAGMYDKVGKSFYTGINGTFTVGEDIN